MSASAPLERSSRDDAHLDRPLTGWWAGSALAVFVALAVLAAAIEVLLVPLRYGTAVLPVSVGLAALTNVVLAAWARRSLAWLAAPVVPVAAWVLTVVLLSLGRPEGDVLLLGNAPLIYVLYAMLLAGSIGGIATILRTDPRRRGEWWSRPRAGTGPVPQRAPAGPPGAAGDGAG